MNRLMAGGVAGALAAAGVIAFAVPGQAQEQPEYETFQGEADIRPFDARPGQQVTASDDSCFEGTTDIYWLLHSYEVEDSGQAALNADGSWNVTFAAPDEPGDYLFFGLCMPPGATQPDMADIDVITRHLEEEPPVDLLEEWGVDSLLFYNMVLTVVDDTPNPTNPNPTSPNPTEPTTPPATHGPTTAPPRGARPATPVPGTPDFTG
jgi:hypothetical protein